MVVIKSSYLCILSYIAPKCFCAPHRCSFTLFSIAMSTNQTPACRLPCSACYIWCIKISSWLTACPNRHLLEASSGRHHSHLSSAPTRLLTLALGSNLSLAVRGCLSLGLCPLSHYTLCPSFLQWFVLLWHCSSQLELNAYKVYTFHMLILLGS